MVNIPSPPPPHPPSNPFLVRSNHFLWLFCFDNSGYFGVELAKLCFLSIKCEIWFFWDAQRWLLATTSHNLANSTPKINHGNLVQIITFLNIFVVT
jgi:hypothetical protein